MELDWQSTYFIGYYCVRDDQYAAPETSTHITTTKDQRGGDPTEDPTTPRRIKPIVNEVRNDKLSLRREL